MSILRTAATAVVGSEIIKRKKGNGLLGFGLGLIATRIATRSLPGALLIGGAMVAKALYDQAQEEEEELPAADQVIDIEGRSVPKEEAAG
ncbi:MAG: hypothetical protein ABJN65_00695 [Parasphingorhabdus sp.]